jgi:hypothetical protein
MGCIFMVGFDNPSFTFRDDNNDVGGNSYATADTITAFGIGSSSGIPLASPGGYMLNQMSPNVSCNYINSAMGGGSATSTITGVYASASSGSYQSLNN